MKIIEQSAKEIRELSPTKHIERIGKICYKSEGTITEDSNISFVHRLHENHHDAMLEHYRFIFYTNDGYMKLLLEQYRHKYITYTNYDDRTVISFSARAINEITTTTKDLIDCILYSSIISNILQKHKDCFAMFDLSYVDNFTSLDLSYVDNFTSLITEVDDINDIDMLTPEERLEHEWHSVLFTTDRGVSHELVRHRDASFAQESTRYCNYSKGKFNNEIRVIRPYFAECDIEYQLWRMSCESSEKSYFDMLYNSASAQAARSVLPNSLATDIVVTAAMKEWNHILDLRYRDITGQPHPQMKLLMIELIDNVDWILKE